MSISASSFFTMTVSRNSSTLSVFHLLMASSSATSSSSSSSLMIGSAPLTYLMVRPGYLAGRSLLMNAATCGYAPRRHPHTSRIALSYLTLSRVEAPPSSVQQASQSAITAPSSNCFRSWQEEHSSFAELKPRSRHLAASTASAPAALASATRTWLSSSRQPSIARLPRPNCSLKKCYQAM